MDPIIVQNPLSQCVALGATVTLSVSVTNSATLPIGYRWRHAGPVLTNTFLVLTQHTCFLTITNVQPPYTNYSVVVTNLSRPSGYLSTAALLTVLPDTDGDGLPDSWETAYGLSQGSSADRDLDPDQIGRAHV